MSPRSYGHARYQPRPTRSRKDQKIIQQPHAGSAAGEPPPLGPCGAGRPGVADLGAPCPLPGLWRVESCVVALVLFKGETGRGRGDRPGGGGGGRRGRWPEVLASRLRIPPCGAGGVTIGSGSGCCWRLWWRLPRRGVSLSRLSATVAGEADGVGALKTVGVSLSAAVGIGVWPAVSLVSGGAWLSTTTNAPTTAVLGWRLMTVMAGRGWRVPL